MFKAALFISENLYGFQEALIKEVIQCPMVIFYGQSERAVFAERYKERYVFNPLYGVTEISEKGEPIVTGFINPKTPLIRYLVDDYVELTDEGYTIEGHHDTEVLYGKNGEQITFSSINFHDDTFEKVASYQFVQNEIGKCVLKILPENGFSRERLKIIEKRVNKKLGEGFIVQAEIVSSIPLTNRGKYKIIIQNTQGGGTTIVKGGRYIIHGHRDSDVLLGNNGEQISSAAINFHDDTFLGVSAYQFVQDELGKCIVRIVPEDGFENQRIELIRNRITSKLGPGFICDIEMVDNIQLTSRGKYRLFVQNIKKEAMEDEK